MSKRQTVYRPDLIADFSRRLRVALADRRESQTDLALALGGYGTNTISRLCRGDLLGIPLDLLVLLGHWLAARGISIEWLVRGTGPMHVAPLAAGEVRFAANPIADQILRELAARLGVAAPPPAAAPVQEETTP